MQQVHDPKHAQDQEYYCYKILFQPHGVEVASPFHQDMKFDEEADSMDVKNIVTEKDKKLQLPKLVTISISVHTRECYCVNNEDHEA